MLRPLCDPSVRDVFLAHARRRSPTDELKWRALLDLLETCQVLDVALRREFGASGLTESGFLVLAKFALRAADLVRQTPVLLDSYDAARASGIDPCVAVREAYAARRAAEAQLWS